MPVTTSETLKTNQGQMCHKCSKRTAVAQWLDGEGWICPECDPRPRLVTEAPKDAPVDRGRG